MLKKSFAALLAIGALAISASHANAGSIIVVGSASDNGGQHLGNFWGSNGITSSTADQSYDQGLVDVLGEIFSTHTISYIDADAPVPGTTGASAANKTLRTMNVTSQTQAKVDYLNSFDLVFLSNSLGSGTMCGDGTTGTNTNGRNYVWNVRVTKPLVNMKAFLNHTNNRWGWYNTAANPVEGITTTTYHLTVNSAVDTAWTGIAVTSGSVRAFAPPPYLPENNFFNSGSNNTQKQQFGQRQHVFATPVLPATCNGRIIAGWKHTGSGLATNYTNSVAVAFYEAGTPFYTASLMPPGGDRILFILNDDRNQIKPSYLSATAPVNTLRKAYDLTAYWTRDTKALLHNLITEAAPALLVPVELSNFQVD